MKMKQLARICQMEKYYDIVSNAIYKEHRSLKGDIELQIMAELLKTYTESGQWLEDFECDERGELPNELKRGVLSEDGLYNLLCEIESHD